MALSQQERENTRKLIALAREKGYAEEEIEILLMLTCAKQMVESVGSSDEATVRVTEFIRESDNPQDCLEKTLNLAGIE